VPASTPLRLSARLLAAAAVLALAVPATAAATAGPALAASPAVATPVPTAFTHDPVRDREALYDLLDAARAQHGRGPLRRVPAIEAVAQDWSAQMAATGTLAHDPVLGARMPAGWRVVGENVGSAKGASPTALERAWLASPSHRSNQLDRRYDAVGIGIAYGRDGTVYVTTDFAALRRP
jgi:uncharacterized protein YkwD